MKTFDDLDFIKLDQHMNGVQARTMFENNYGVSVVCHAFSYGGNDGLYEIAVLGEDGNLTYDTPVTDNVMGYLSKDDVSDVMKQVQEL